MQIIGFFLSHFSFFTIYCEFPLKLPNFFIQITQLVKILHT